ncbi:unnamed protein product [Ceutorhynchus assimilis]|uniref:Uncharacterized protein n=1 Tax=Ceutorhynchus assimilis TaxID=467358 RepID=A0A9N9MU40_9CUCU|nr:unnamed protein product [Ceutorhynchus assimilis]
MQKPQIHNGNLELTYFFDKQAEPTMLEETETSKIGTSIKNKIWQIFPSACASLTCIPFGLMLGWPSPTYPTLIFAEDSPVPITLDQSAMIAGFLLLGVCFGTLFSTSSIAQGPKNGIIFGNLCIVLGWVLMWQSQNMYWLLASRFLMGSGHGYAMGQIKRYIIEMTEDALSASLVKQTQFYALFGFVLAFAVGPFISFRLFALTSLILATFILFLAIFLPSTPRELIQAKKIRDAKKLLVFLKPDSNPDQEIDKIRETDSNVKPVNDFGFMKIMRDNSLRVNFIKFTFIVICQQYCGAPPTLVYTQIIFSRSNVPYPEYIALGYAVLFFLSNLVGCYISPKYNKKTVLLVSSFSILLLFILNILVIYFKVNEKYFSYTSVIVMYLFIIVYTTSLGSIPFTLINDWFPQNCRVFMTKFYIVMFSLLGLSITKIFQVLIGQFPLYIPFCLFSAVIVFAIGFISIFMSGGGNKHFYKTNIAEIVVGVEEKK